MKISVTLIICLILILPILVNAELLITPSNLDINVITNQEKTYQLQLNNTRNFTIYNIEFSSLDDFDFPTISSIDPDESIIIDITILTDSQYSETKQSTISFNYYIPIIESPETVNINISESGFNPVSITIIQGSMVRWTNYDDIIHSVTSGLFDHDILPNDAYEFTFENVGIVNYFDNYFPDNQGIITIINDTVEELTHNEDYDKIVTFNVNSQNPSTSLGLELFDDNFSIDYNTATEGLISITNTGGETAYNVELSNSNGWITFDENNFDLSPGEINYVNFILLPKDITKSSQTNQSYSIPITLSANNVGSLTKNIEVFIHYSEFVTDSYTDIGDLIKRLAEIQKELEQIRLNETRGQIIYTEKEFPVNYTPSRVRELEQNYAELKTSMAFIEKFIKETLGSNIEDLQKLLNLVNQSSYETSLQAKENQETTGDIEDILAVFVILILLVVGGVLIIKKVQKKVQSKNIKRMEYK